MAATKLDALIAALRAADSEVAYTSALVRPCRPGERANSHGGVRYEAAAMPRENWEAVRDALEAYLHTETR